jgi:hypothetical protein
MTDLLDIMKASCGDMGVAGKVLAGKPEEETGMTDADVAKGAYRGKGTRTESPGKSLTERATDIIRKGKFMDALDPVGQDAEVTPGKGFGSGFSTGQAMGSSADQAGSSAAGAVGGAQSVVGEVRDTVGKACDCGAKPCKCVDKALKAGDLVIPFHQRTAHYDPDGIRRSATQQTSRMYTALAEPVKDTLRHVMNESDSDPRVRAAKSFDEQRKAVADLRDKLALSAMETRKSVRFGF